MPLRNVFLEIEKQLNVIFHERADVIRGLIVALLARVHVLLLGPPGTGKSALAREVCQRIGGQYFERVLGRTSTPEELFGPVSLRALEQDRYERVIAGKLPEAHVAFIDEIFKCNSAVLNLLLPVLNERVFHNDGNAVQVPLHLAVGASNELPEDREELGALWDRFLLRYVVNYIRDPNAFGTMLQITQTVWPPATVSLADLEKAQQEVRSVDIHPIIPQIIDLRDKLTQASIVISDRRWKQVMDLVRAQAWLEGRKAAASDDLAILVPALWQEPEQIPQVRQMVLEIASPHEIEIQNIVDEAREVYQKAMRAATGAGTGAKEASEIGAETNTKLKILARRLADVQRQIEDGGGNTTAAREAAKQIEAWNKEVVKTCLGVNI